MGSIFDLSCVTLLSLFSRVLEVVAPVAAAFGVPPAAGAPAAAGLAAPAGLAAAAATATAAAAASAGTSTTEVNPIIARVNVITLNFAFKLVSFVTFTCTTLMSLVACGCTTRVSFVLVNIITS